MKKLVLLTVAVLIMGCQRTDEKFLITENSVGAFPKDSLIGSLERIYKDFEVEHNGIKPDALTINEPIIIIKEKNEAKTLLLEITPQKKDNQKIANIEILDPRFKTEKGININSTFADIKKAYSEFDVESSFSSVVIMPKHTNIYFTISKSSLLPSATGEITVSDIPDTAKINRFMINWQ